MIRDAPSLFVWSLSEQRLSSFDAFLEHYATTVVFYGSGKAALRDGLAGLVEPGQNVLIPAYLPDAVAEPFHDLGLEARYYAIQENLAPDLADIERRIDDETAAVMSVNYFGFPQPGLEEFVSLVDEYDCYHIDDNAHGPFSVDNGTLLGTRGSLGVTSLWKLLPIPNGAVLYCNDDDVVDRLEPSSFAGVSDRVTVSDCHFVLKSVLVDLLSANPTVRRSVTDLVTGRGRAPSIPNPADRYEADKVPMSKLSSHVVEDVNPSAIRDSRRSNYRAWRRIFDAVDDVEPLFESLPRGICPQVFPVRTPTPQRLLAELERCGVTGGHTWPRLSSTVTEDPAYEVSTNLAREVVVLPVHQHIDPSSIDAVGDRLRW
ncbi:DegT/DnrJ/EryC1/StrS aminotransferase family protein [Natronorubrum sp. JWXQ-INN-674]|uniref:DegT/DnrJ/EryC1/StrS aminotransferase family protein n=1 Tax=Natronorubrum halalkaliphilum TaxID=2691917 RepID=A0A6B0VM49_9EURY|nr:DegT/DnrJ/EryC1/StrS family aminotransferase [Natronorubrum halalkaliphilum]MXV62548.1 DegT/DnrJ/EryC1/StrS aminotransferase family protein [Natronorubrum halalkaliphilum]